MLEKERGRERSMPKERKIAVRQTERDSKDKLHLLMVNLHVIKVRLYLGSRTES